MTKPRTLMLTIPGVPVPQPRPRAVIAGKHARVYSPQDRGVGDWRNLIRIMVADKWQGPPSERPIHIDCCFVFPRQQVNIWKTKPMLRYPHVSRPDFDNLVKLVCDAIEGIVYRNDWQVAKASIEKVHAAGAEEPHLRLGIGEYWND